MSVIQDRVDSSPRRPTRPTVLVLPGLHGSGPRHWQSIWERRHREFQRVEQATWSEPRLGDWATTLERAVRAAPAPVILVAHSLACALVAHWARAGATERVAAALLVAPADVDALGHVEVRSFAPIPLERLPFASWVVASDNDPFVTLDRARAFARAWGARFLEAGRCGHINLDSGHGPWPEGEALLEQLERTVMEPLRRPCSREGASEPTSLHPRREALAAPSDAGRNARRRAGREGS
jgi:predicted alpha/beta hydrolase family esterase